MCHKSLESIQIYSENWKRLNPEYEIRLYDDVLCKDFLLNEYSQLHLDIFNFIPDGPIKADFWRACIINKYGGLYVDADIKPLIPLKHYIESDDDFVTCISQNCDFQKKEFQLNPHFIMCNKNNSILQTCIDKYIELYKTKRESYSYWRWSICNIIYIEGIKERRSHIYKDENGFKYKFLYETTPNTCEYNNEIVLNNRYDTYIGHNFIKSVPKREKLKIGITFNLPETKEGLFTNGIRQNALYFCEVLLHIDKYDVFFIIADKQLEDKTIVDFLCYDKRMKYVKESHIIQEEFNIIITFGYQLPLKTVLVFRKLGTKHIFYNCGNQYIIDSEYCLYLKKERNTGFERFQFFDECWNIPQMTNTNHHYLKTLYRCNVIEVPFIWSPAFINASQVYKKRDSLQKTLAIFEPNLSIMKWTFPAILICENAYRDETITNKIKKVHITNVTNDSSNFNLDNFNKLVYSLDLKRDGKLSIERRYNTLYFMTNHADIAVSHSWENGLNYLYLDLAWMGWPVIHNGHLCKDIGYYYDEFNYEMGAEVLKHAILTHDANSEKYLTKNRLCIDRYLPSNKYLQFQYETLISNISA